MKEKLETPRTDEAYCDAMRSLDGGSSIAIDQMRALAQQLEHELYIREISCKCDMEAWDRDRKWWREQLAACQRRCADLQAKGEEDLKLCYREMDADSKAIEHLYSQIAGLEKDAERYRWLRDGNNDLEGICAGMQLSGSYLDAAIDAALAAQEPSK